MIAESERLEDTDNRGAGIDSNIHLSIRGCGAERIVDDLVGANLAMHECDRYRSSEPLLISYCHHPSNDWESWEMHQWLAHRSPWSNWEDGEDASFYQGAKR